MPPVRLTKEKIASLFKQYEQHKHKIDSKTDKLPNVISCDVFIAGSGPIASAYARTILQEGEVKGRAPRVVMAEIGSKDSPVAGEHQKNSVKYQKDIDAFVHVINGALQKVSIPPTETHQSTLGGTGWRPPPSSSAGRLIYQGHNPLQDPERNLRDSAITRTVGGMATHWTASCPIPNDEEREEIHKVIDKQKLDGLLEEAGDMLNVHLDEYDHSIRHGLVKKALGAALKERAFHNIPLAVKRRTDNPDFVTWTGSNTILGDYASKFELLTEARVTEVGPIEGRPGIVYALVRNLNTNEDIVVFARAFVLACGAVATPQILWNSPISSPPALGHYLSEQSLTFCQIIMKKEIVDSVPLDDPRVISHKKKHPNDPLPIPFNDPEPQLMIPYSHDFPWHVQVHRDAFSYGDIGPKADPRVVVDLRFFGKQEIRKENRIFTDAVERSDWTAGVTDIYGMPQVTFDVTQSEDDKRRDQRMMNDMTNIANALGSYLPGAYPQFMEPGLALHITGTMRLGKDVETSVADGDSKVHGFPNLWVGGNGCLPDATCTNPTRTSVAVAIAGARSVLKFLALRK